ncbi:MAG: hypothetical protein ACE5E0_00990 [Terriglobia bacterium]
MIRTSTIVGIDENGFGPVLGPLVATATWFDFRSDYEPSLLWDSLSGVVSRSRADYPDRLPVSDSKKVFSAGQRGLQMLEEISTAFGAVVWPGRSSPDRDRLLSELTLYPKFCYESTRHTFCSPAGGSGQTAATGLARFERTDQLKHRLETGPALLKGLKTAVMCPGEFNRLSARHGSKFYVNWVQFERLIEWVLRTTDAVDLHFVCGKIGSQRQYGEYLRRGSLGRFAVTAEENTAACSTYRLESDERSLTVSFVRDADSDHFPVALASLVGKYVREVHTSHQNSFFRGFRRDLTDASGYREKLTYAFIKDTAPTRAELGIPDRCFLRDR